MTFATVSIGRNIGNDGGEKLDSRDWDRFRLEIVDLFVPVDEFHVSGVSISDEHGSEETYQHGGYLYYSIGETRNILADLARDYRQTAIAFVIGGERILPS